MKKIKKKYYCLTIKLKFDDGKEKSITYEHFKRVLYIKYDPKNHHLCSCIKYGDSKYKIEYSNVMSYELKKYHC